MLTYSIHDTISGQKVTDIPAADGSWTRRINGMGNATHTFMLRDANYPYSRSQNRNFFQTNSRVLAVRDGRTVLYAGVMLKPTYTQDTGALSVPTVEIREFWRVRMTFGVANYQDGDLQLTNVNEQAAVAALITRGTRWGSTWELPIDLPSGQAAGDFDADWKRYQCLTIDTLLKQIEARGFEIEFSPYLANDADDLRWSTTVARKITRGAIDLPVSVADSAVTGLKHTLDGTRQLSGAFFAGNGTDEDMVTGFAWAMDGPRIPVRDSLRTAKDIRAVKELNKLASADLAANRSPIEQWSFNVTAGDTVSSSVLLPGNILRLSVLRDEWIDDGNHDLRVIALRGSDGYTFTPEVQIHGS